MATPEAAPKKMEERRPHLVNASDGLRKVELDVLVPKIMKKNALASCGDAMQQFADCCRGRTMSLVFYCRKENQALDDCLRANMTDADFLVAKNEFKALKAANLAKIKAEGDKGFLATEHMGATGM